MKEKYLQFIASFMIVLVLTIPYSFAAINSISVKGSDGIEGFARGNDVLLFSAEVSLANANITQDQVYLGSNIKFDKCTASPNNSTICILAYPKTGNTSFESKPLPYVINLYKDLNKQQLDDSKSGSILIDNRAPQITLASDKKAFSGKDIIQINYEVSDFSCSDPACANKCIGVKGIEFYAQNNSIKQAIVPNSTGCSIKSSISIEAKTLKEGKNTIFARALDNFNQVSAPASLDFTLDLTPPDIFADTFTIVRKGVSISSYSPKEVPVEVHINISAPDLDPKSVAADFTVLNPAKSYKDAKASCRLAEQDLYACKWLIGLNPGSKAPASRTRNASQESSGIIINASDLSGNTISVAIAKTLSLDDKGPVVQTLTVPVSVGGKLYSKPTGSVIAAIDESTGLSAEDVFLYVDNFKAKAKSCELQSNWLCKWSNINFPGPKTILSIKQDTVDILLNPVAEIKTAEVIVDNKAPVVDDVNVSSVGTLSDVAPDLFKVGDKIAVVANITEENELTATADFSKFITGASKVAGTCQKIEEDKQVCLWLSDPIAIAGTNLIKLNFSDPVGNEAYFSTELKVLGLDTTPVPDYWKNTVSCSPKTVDRQLGTFINQRVYCSVDLTPKLANVPVSTVFISQAECSANPQIVQSVETFNTELGSVSPVIKFTLKKDKLEYNELKIACALKIVSRLKNADKITKNQENENVEIEVKFYNMPLGVLDENVQKKIDKAKEDAQGVWKTIGALNKVIFYAKKVCQMFGILYNVVTIYYILTAKMKTSQDICWINPLAPFMAPICITIQVAATSNCFGQQGTENSADLGWKTTGGKFCKFVNCQWAPGVWGKYQEFITQKINELPGAKYLPGPGVGNLPGAGIQQPGAGGTRTGLAGYMDPNNNLVTASLFACVPGIISGLDKFRQIKCLYADCLENSVGKEGLPVTACENLKSYTTCKYVTGEVFAAIPYTAVFDYFTSIIKEALLNPFGVGIGALCYFTCPQPSPGSAAGYIACEGVKVASKTGEVFQNIRGLVNEGFKIRQDYCSRLNLEENNSTGTSEVTEQQPSNQNQQQSQQTTQQNQNNQPSTRPQQQPQET